MKIFQIKEPENKFPSLIVYTSFPKDPSWFNFFIIEAEKDITLQENVLFAVSKEKAVELARAIIEAAGDD